MSTPAQISQLLDAVMAAWQANDAAGMAALFTADGALVNPFGERADGHAALRAMYETYFAGMLAGTSTAVRVLAVRELGPDIAFVDAEQDVLGPSGDVVLPLRVALVLRQEGGAWRIVDSRPHVLAAVPD